MRSPLRSARFAPLRLPAEPGMAANNKLKFTGLQRTFLPAQNCDPANQPVDVIRREGLVNGTLKLRWCRVDLYNRQMARGWESKSVEEQQSAANTQVESKQRLTPQQAAERQARDALAMSRRRVLRQLQEVQNPRHRQMLEIALSELDGRLARLG
jgi:hypothetical protein